MRCCRQWASAPGATRLVFSIKLMNTSSNEQFVFWHQCHNEVRIFFLHLKLKIWTHPNLVLWLKIKDYYTVAVGGQPNPTFCPRVPFFLRPSITLYRCSINLGGTNQQGGDAQIGEDEEIGEDKQKNWCSFFPVSWCPGVLVSQCPGVPMSWCSGVLVSQCPGGVQ